MRASFFTAALLIAVLPLHAERYGAETALTIQGTYYLSGETTTLPSGVEKATYTTQQVTNATVLARMAADGLIDGVKGYTLVMVSRAHAADGVKFFATHRTKDPVAVPSSLFFLHVEDGPTNGVALFTADGDLKNLDRETRNSAEILQGDFFGMGVLTQKWTEKAVKTDGIVEVVELVNARGTFDGVLNDAPEAGVGTLAFKLTRSKPVDLTRYGMATSAASGTTGGVLQIGSGTSLLNSAGSIIKNGTLAGSGTSTYCINTLSTPGDLTFSVVGDSDLISGDTVYGGSLDLSIPVSGLGGTDSPTFVAPLILTEYAPAASSDYTAIALTDGVLTWNTLHPLPVSWSLGGVEMGEFIYYTP